VHREQEGEQQSEAHPRAGYDAAAAGSFNRPWPISHYQPSTATRTPVATIRPPAVASP